MLAHQIRPNQAFRVGLLGVVPRDREQGIVDFARAEADVARQLGLFLRGGRAVSPP